jgi:hypothetical protein
LPFFGISALTCSYGIFILEKLQDFYNIPPAVSALGSRGKILSLAQKIRYSKAAGFIPRVGFRKHHAGRRGENSKAPLFTGGDEAAGFSPRV